MKDLNEADDMVPKDTIGWILQYEKDDDLRDDIKEEPEEDLDHPLSQQNLTRFTLPQNFTPFYLQVNYTDTQLSHRFVRFEIPKNGNYDEIKSKVEAYLDEL